MSFSMKLKLTKLILCMWSLFRGMLH
uniref:Uncharacterized protein n=1 Tax=Anguilla anguilla TaxID=7936 RepID=A0A0E9U988_ANGAN